MTALARLLGVLAVATTPFLLTAPPASATGGCSVDNVDTVSTLSLSCSYVTGGGVVDLTCTLLAGRCVATRSDGSIGGTCIAYANTQCFTHFDATAGDTITLTVEGGSGAVNDEV